MRMDAVIMVVGVGLLPPNLVLSFPPNLVMRILHFCIFDATIVCDSTWNFYVQRVELEFLPCVRLLGLLVGLGV